MKIQKIHLINFKRFTNIEIVNIPENAQLVVLIGANGSGKSAIFDAFNFIDGAIKKDIALNDDFWDYFKKSKDMPFWLCPIQKNNTHTPHSLFYHLPRNLGWFRLSESFIFPNLFL